MFRVIGLAILLLPLLALPARAEHLAQRAGNYVIPMERRVHFKSGTTKLDRLGREHDAIFGRLFLPKGPGPFPAVVLAHDWYGAYRVQHEWGDRLRAWGYAAFMVDSFDPRGAATGLGVPSRTRAADFYGALAYLRTRKDISGDKVAIIGWGQGGNATLLAVQSTDHNSRFTAAVAYYPNCIVMGGAAYAPLLILMGDREDEPTFLRGHLATCRKLAVQDQIKLQILNNATHIFDYYQTNMPWAGSVLTHNPVATKASIKRVRKFLEQHLRMEQ